MTGDDPELGDGIVTTMNETLMVCGHKHAVLASITLIESNFRKRNRDGPGASLFERSLSKPIAHCNLNLHVLSSILTSYLIEM